MSAVTLSIPAFEHLPAELTWTEKLAYLATSSPFDAQAAFELSVEHEWKDGKYIRTLRIPSDTLLIGSPPRYSHLIELLEGRVLHIREHERVERAAPFSMMTMPDCQMVVYTYTPVLARSTHRDTGERDPQWCRDAHFVPAQVTLTLGRELRERLAKPEAA